VIRWVLAAAAVLAATAPGGAGAEAAADPARTPIVYATGSSGPAPGAADLFVRSLDGRVVRLTRTRSFEGFPSWSPDRSRIAFVSDRDGGRAHLFVLDAAGRVRQVTRGPGHDLYPAWSPDGRWLAFSSTRAGGEAELWLVRPDGTGLRRLTRTARWVDDTQPRFSPDGRHLVFASNRVAFSNYELFRIRVADGGGLVRLTRWGSGRDGAPGDDLMPEYAPDGRRIAFVSDRGGGYGIWTMRPDGRGLRLVVRHRGLNLAFPRFAPDGRSLVYASFRADREPPGFTLRVVAADGARRRLLGPGSEPDW
jgi:TolB protein